MDARKPPQTVTRGELADYLGVDSADEMTRSNLELAAQAANGYLAGALGYSYDPGDARAKAVGLAVGADFYDQRCLTDAAGSAKASSALRRMVADLCEQLRCEGRDGA